MNDLEERLRADLPRLATTILDEPIEPMARLEAPRARSRMRQRAIAAAAAAMCLVVVGVAVAVNRGEDAHVPNTSASVAVSSRWRALPPSPLGPRANAVTVWTGRDVIVWGGYRGSTVPLAFQSGAAYNPVTNSWRQIADNQWAAPGAHGVWAGDRVFILAKDGGAAYDPATNRWRGVAMLPDQAGAFLAAAASGTAVSGVVAMAQGKAIAVARYDRSRNAWHIGKSLRAPWRSDLHNASAVWIGKELVVSDGSGAVWGYNPTTNTWRVVPGLPRGATASSVTSIGGALVAVYNANGSLRAAKFVNGAWRTIANTGHAPIAEPVAVNAGGSLVVIDRSGAAKPIRAVPATRQWLSLAGYSIRRGADGNAVWAGSGLFVWGGLPPGTPATFANPTPARPGAAWYTG